MITLNACVVELEPDNSYRVCIEGLHPTTVSDNGAVDDSVVTFKSALSTVVELLLSEDYTLILLREWANEGHSCRNYTVHCYR